MIYQLGNSDLDSVGSRLFRPLRALGSGHDASDAVSLMFRFTEGDQYLLLTPVPTSMSASLLVDGSRGFKINMAVF